MVNGCGLNDNRQITARTDRKGMAHDLVSKILGVLLMKSQTVILLVAVPLFQLNNQVYRLGILNALNTEQGLHINDTNTAKLNKMTCDIRCRTNQCNITYLTKLYNIITYKTVTTLDQLKGSLALADSTFTCDQDALAINIHKHTVNGNTRCQLNAQPTDDLSHQTGGGSLCHKCRNIVFVCKIDHIL